WLRFFFFFFSSRRRHTRFSRDWSSDVCSSDLGAPLRHFPSLAALLTAVAADGFRRLVAEIDGHLARAEAAAAAEGRRLDPRTRQIGRASCRERGESKGDAGCVQSNSTRVRDQT